VCSVPARVPGVSAQFGARTSPQQSGEARGGERIGHQVAAGEQCDKKCVGRHRGATGACRPAQNDQCVCRYRLRPPPGRGGLPFGIARPLLSDEARTVKKRRKEKAKNR